MQCRLVVTEVSWAAWTSDDGTYQLSRNVSNYSKFKWINQPDAAISQVYYLWFKYSSTCFGHPHTHHQELTAVAASGLPLESGSSSAVGCGRAGWQPAWPQPTALLPPCSNGKPEAATAVSELLMMGVRMPETCWAVFKSQVINLRNCCIWLVDSLECMMMHGLANAKVSN